MKNKLITNDSYIRRLIKESIIFNTKKQSLAQAFSDNFRMFENKFKSFDDKIDFDRLIKKFEDFINLFQDDVRRMARQSDMFEQRGRRNLMEGSKYIEENFPDYKKFMNRFLNCENSQQCLFLTNRFVDECQYFISNVKKQIDNPETKKGSTRIELKLKDVPKLLDSMSNRSNFKDIVLNILATVTGPGFLGKSPASNIYTVLMYIILKFDNLLGSSIDIKKISNGKFLLRINHPKANQIILDTNKQEANKA
jgi:hypothetical protein